MTRPAFCILAGLRFSAAGAAGRCRFKSSSNLAILDVTVRDSSGKELPLRARKILLSRRRRRRRFGFEFQQLGRRLRPPLPCRFSEYRLRHRSQPTPGSIQYQDRRLMIMFFDFSRWEFLNSCAQKAALEFVDKRMGPSDLVST
jgi:hypothetical protein